tara:strand:+ start:901 stop:2019 length:1119 start_codon:yes stop_codon:yes gene_type:complete
MLEQAIIDADQLKETAKKTAEEAVVEKYQSEIKEAVEKILEQDEVVETEMSIDPDGNLEVVEDLPATQTTDMEEVVEIDLNKLEELMAEEMEEDGLDPDDMSSREQVAEEIEALVEDDEIELSENDLLELAGEKEFEINEDNLASVIAEILSEDMIDDSAKEEEAEGQQSAVGVDDEKLEEAEADLEEAGKTTAKKARTEKKTMKDLDKDAETRETDFLKKKPKAANESKRLKGENTSLLKEQTRTDKKVQLLKEKVDKYGTVINKLKNKLNESNLTNAKLLYQNRILNSASLNERQKDKIVDAISNATTVEEAKIIFETLQSAVGSFIKNKAPQSLREVVSRSSSAFIPRKEVQPKADVFSERMKRLAGLK